MLLPVIVLLHVSFEWMDLYTIKLLHRLHPAHCTQAAETVIIRTWLMLPYNRPSPVCSGSASGVDVLFSNPRLGRT